MKDYKRIVFLDIDGVMASIPYLYKGKGFIDPSKCKLLNQLEDISAEVVISSSWGYDEGKTEKSLRACGLKLPIIGYTDHSVHHNHKWACRGNEIEKWLLENMYENKDVLAQNTVTIITARTSMRETLIMNMLSLMITMICFWVR